MTVDTLPLCAGAALGPYILAGRENRRSRHEGTLRRGTNFYQLVFVEDGSVSYRTGGRRRTPPSPFGILMEPCAPVEIELPAAVTWHLLMFDAVYQPLRVTWEGRSVPSTCGPFTHVERKRQPGPREVWGVDLPLAIPRELTDSGLACTRWCNARWWMSPADYARANYRLGLWLLDLVEIHMGRVETGTDWLSRLRDYCRKHMVHGISVTELAKAAGIGRHQLRRSLLAEVGMTPRQFLNDVRVQHACSLLRSTAYPVAKVGDICGYSSAAVFCRTFRRLVGITPLKWHRKSCLDTLAS